MTRLFRDRAAAGAAERRRAALAQARRSSTPTPSPGSSRTTRCSTPSWSTSPTRPTSRSASSTPRSFYELLDRHLAAGGFAVVQTTSPLFARRSFWTVRRTLEAAGLTATPYHAHVPTFGEWGFVLAEPAAVGAAARAARRACASSPSTGCRRCSQFPPDMARVPAEVNRLSNQVLVHSFEDEWGKVQRVTRARRALAGAASPLARRLAGVRARAARADYDGGWLGASHERGHRLRDAREPHAAGADAPAHRRASSSAAASPGWRGACAGARRHRRLRAARAGRRAGGNSRGHAIGGMRCPLGAHYLPLPGARRARGAASCWTSSACCAHARRPHGATTSATCATARRSACSSTAPGTKACCRRAEPALAHARRSTAPFAREVDRVQRELAFALPTQRAAWTDGHARARRAYRSPQWLDATWPRRRALRWYLDYCCRDDYGAGVSAGLGLGRAALLRQPPWLLGAGRRRCSRGERGVSPGRKATPGWSSASPQPLRERLRSAHTVLQRDRRRRQRVQVLALHEAAQQARGVRRQGGRARDAVLRRARACCARRCRPLTPRPRRCATRRGWWPTCNCARRCSIVRIGAPPAWDNVRYGAPSLGYVVGDAPEPARRRAGRRCSRPTGRCASPRARSAARRATGARGRSA